jgi:hypothetical protein
MEDVSSILPRALKKQLLCRKPRVLEVLGPVWPRVVGKLIAQHSRLAAFNEGTLRVAAFSPPWAAQLSQMAEQIRDEVNRFCGAPVVRKLRVCCDPCKKPDVPNSASMERPATAERLAYSSEEASRVLWAGHATNLDPELAEAVERSFVKYFSRKGKGLDACL